MICEREPLDIVRHFVRLRDTIYDPLISINLKDEHEETTMKIY